MGYEHDDADEIELTVRYVSDDVRVFDFNLLQEGPKQVESLLLMKGTIGGLPCKLWVDCGANSNFISEKIVGRYSLSTSAIRPELNVRFADGRLTTCNRG